DDVRHHPPAEHAGDRRPDRRPRPRPDRGGRQPPRPAADVRRLPAAARRALPAARRLTPSTAMLLALPNTARAAPRTAARAAVAGLFTVLVVYAFLAARGRRLAACVAAGALASASHFTWIARTGRIDVPLTLTVTLAVLALRCAGDAASPRARFAWQLGGYAA